MCMEIVMELLMRRGMIGVMKETVMWGPLG